jgi:hypothetical protein
MSQSPTQALPDGQARLSWGLVLVAGALCFARVIGNVVSSRLEPRNPWWAYTPAWIVQSLLIAVCIVTAALMAERAVERGRSRWQAYTVAMCLATLATTILFLLYAGLFMLDFREFTPRRIVGVSRWVMTDALFKGGLAAFLYSRYQRLRASTRELRAVQERHAIHERELADSGLRALRARVDPEALIESLRAIRRQYEATPQKAESELKALIAHLRLATARASP